MDYEVMMAKAKAAVHSVDPNVDTDKLNLIYSSNMMELTRVLLMPTGVDKIYAVTLNTLDDSSSVKSYIPAI